MESLGTVSVITPSYNTAAFIAETINSVLAQTYADWEMIIVDDCSTDATDDAVRPFLSDPRIRYIKNERNLGAAESRNRALREAKGRFVAFLDSDDLWLPEKLEKQLEFMAKTGAKFSYTEYEQIDESSKSVGVTVTGPKKISRLGMNAYCWPGCLTVMYDRYAVGLVQIKDIKKNNDYAMWLEVSSVADCRLLEQNLAKYRLRQGSISRQRLSSLIRWHYRLWHEAEEKCAPVSLLMTAVNMICGLYKKLFFVKRR